ncbi:hypothetical protein SESBI_28926 [Sesbania bispinosa]|nr:hypothetical protein SESBI_28926 [Sesbania bispinosa]
MPKRATSLASSRGRGVRLALPGSFNQTSTKSGSSTQQPNPSGSPTQQQNPSSQTAKQTKADYVFPIQTLLALQDCGLTHLPKKTWAYIASEEDEDESQTNLAILINQLAESQTVANDPKQKKIISTPIETQNKALLRRPLVPRPTEIMGPKKPNFKLHERRNVAAKKLKLSIGGLERPMMNMVISSPSSYYYYRSSRGALLMGQGVVMASPVSPLEMLARGSPRTPKSLHEEEEKLSTRLMQISKQKSRVGEVNTKSNKYECLTAENKIG